MTLVNMDTVATHGELDLINDALASCFNAQDSTRLQNVISSGMSEINSRSAHTFPKSIPLNE